MLMFLATLGSLALGGLAVSIARAPEGFETETGFQIVSQPKTETRRTPAASHLVLARVRAGKGF